MPPRYAIGALCLLFLLGLAANLHAQDCPQGLTDCNGSCVDLMKDEENCGSCGEVCDPGEICQDGSCVLNCQDGLTNCGGTCVDLNRDEGNCGQCNLSCPAGYTCQNGSCVLVCPAPLIDCGGVCVDLLQDERNCGQCYQQCPPGYVCQAGRCELACPLPLLNCGGQCVDILHDPDHCGQCDNACPEGKGCVEGQCVACDDPVAVIDVQTSLQQVRLDQNTPNPFNPRTRIRFWLGEEAEVSLRIYDLAGRLVRVVTSGTHYSEGTHALDWDGRAEDGVQVASGVYVYRLRAGEHVVSRTLTLLK